MTYCFFLKIGFQISSLGELKDIIPHAEKKLASIMSSSATKILLADRKNGHWLHYTLSGEVQRSALNSGLAGMVLKYGKHECVNNAYAHQQFNGQVDLETSMPLIIWPMKGPHDESEVIGVIEVINVKGIEGLATTNQAKLSTYDIEAIEFFSNQLARVIYDKLPKAKETKEV